MLIMALDSCFHAKLWLLLELNNELSSLPSPRCALGFGFCVVLTYVLLEFIQCICTVDCIIRERESTVSVMPFMFWFRGSDVVDMLTIHMDYNIIISDVVNSLEIYM